MTENFYIWNLYAWWWNPSYQYGPSEFFLILQSHSYFVQRHMLLCSVILYKKAEGFSGVFQVIFCISLFIRTPRIYSMTEDSIPGLSHFENNASNSDLNRMICYESIINQYQSRNGNMFLSETYNPNISRYETLCRS